MKDKTIFTLLVIFILGFTLYKPLTDDLNGKIFEGRATEITPPDVDRMPMVHDELIKFENGILRSKVFDIYGVKDCAYSSALDERRAIALDAVIFNATSPGAFNGRDVTVEFSGSVMGDKNLSGTILIRFPDNSEVKYLVEAVLNN